MAGFSERMIGAATLHAPTYEEVERDTDGTGQAAAVVALVAVASAIGAYGLGGLYGAVGAVLAALVGWVIWSAITLVIGTMVFDGTADMGQMLRVLGFAQAVGVLKILGIVPLLGSMVAGVAEIWMLVCGVVAIRQVLDFTTGKAIGTVLLGWLVKAALGMMLAMFSFGFIRIF
jgi:hypothetical protein